MLINGVRPVADQVTIGYESAERIGCRQSVSSCERNDQLTIIVQQRTGRRDQPVIRSTCKFSNGALNVFAILSAKWDHLDPGQPRSRLNCGELADTGGCTRISDDPNTRQARCNLLKQFEPFRPNFVVEN